MTDITYIILFILGLCIGSFVNVLLIRYDSKKDRFFSFSRTRGRSHCMSCKKILKWYELIPLFSFIIQGGKCRSCKNNISLQYPIVEFFSGLIFVFVPFILTRLFPFMGVFQEWIFVVSSILWIFVLLAMLCAFWIDVKYYIIPNALNMSITVAGIGWVLILSISGLFKNMYFGSFLRQYTELFPSFNMVWKNHLLGFFVGATFFFLIVYLSKGTAMGMGDVKLIGALGLLFGWPDIVVIMSLAFIIGALYSLILMSIKKKGFKDKVPFGPFIVLGALLVFFYGAGLLNLYFGIIGV